MKRTYNIKVTINDMYDNLYQDDEYSQKDIIKAGLEYSASLLKDKWGHDMSLLFKFKII